MFTRISNIEKRVRWDTRNKILYVETEMVKFVYQTLIPRVRFLMRLRETKYTTVQIRIYMN